MNLTNIEWYRLTEIAADRGGAPAGFMPTTTQSLADKGLIRVTGRVEIDSRVIFYGTALVSDAGRAVLREREDGRHRV